MLRVFHAQWRAWIPTMGKDWNAEKKSWLSTKKKKQWITASLVRNSRSRKWKTYKFSIHDISGGKADTASDPGQDTYLRSCHFLLFFLLCIVFSSMLRTTSVSWKWLQRHPHSSCIYLFLPHPKAKEPRNAGLFKRDSGTISSCTGSSFLEIFSLTEKLWGFPFLSARALPSHRHPQTLLQHRVSGLHRPARLIPCGAATNASPNAKGFKTGSTSHPCTPQPLCLNRA